MAKANITFSHPYETGKGCSLQVDLHYQSDEKPGFIRFSFANQIGNGFDYDNSIVCDLVIDEVAKVLLVLRHEIDKSIEIVAKRVSDTETKRMVVCRASDGFDFLVIVNNGDGIFNATIRLTPSEALALRLALEGSMFFLAFIKGVNP